MAFEELPMSWTRSSVQIRRVRSELQSFGVHMGVSEAKA